MITNISTRKKVETDLLRNDTYKEIICPKSKSLKIKKNGKRNDNQRYRCSDCKHIFSLSSHINLRSTKLPFEKWYDFLDMTLYDISLRNIAKRIGISLPTSFLIRHKLFESLKFFQDSVILSENIYDDELYFPRNNKNGEKIDYREFRKHSCDKRVIEC